MTKKIERDQESQIERVEIRTKTKDEDYFYFKGRDLVGIIKTSTPGKQEIRGVISIGPRLTIAIVASIFIVVVINTFF